MIKKIKIISITILIALFRIHSSWSIEGLLSSPQEHDNFMKESIRSAKHTIVIVSPFVTSWKLKDNTFNGVEGLGGCLKEAIESGKSVTVFTDQNYGANRKNTIEGRAILESLGVRLHIVSNLHSKNLIIDDKIITFGSFNWLSADTNPDGKYCNYETTTIIREAGTVSKIKEELHKLKVVVGNIYSGDLLKNASDEHKLSYALKLYQEKSDNIPHYQEIAKNIINHLFLFCMKPQDVFNLYKEIKDIIIKRKDLDSCVAGSYAFHYVGHPDCEEFSEILLSNVEKREDINKAARRILNTGANKKVARLQELYENLNRMNLTELAKEFNDGLEYIKRE